MAGVAHLHVASTVVACTGRVDKRHEAGFWHAACVVALAKYWKAEEKTQKTTRTTRRTTYHHYIFCMHMVRSKMKMRLALIQDIKETSTVHLFR